MSGAAELERLLAEEGGPAEELFAAPDGSVWRLEPGPSHPRSRIADLQRRILGMVGGGPLVIHHESPVDWEVTGRFAEVAPGRWRTSGLDASRAEVIAWLEVGDWLLYPGVDALIGDPPDLARCSPTAVLAVLAEHRLDFLVDAFHDNRSWVIGLAVPHPGRFAVRTLRQAHCKRGPDRCEACRRMDAHRPCLLDLEPPHAGRLQRRVIEIGRGDQRRFVEFDVVRAFADPTEARRYATDHRVDDVELD